MKKISTLVAALLLLFSNALSAQDYVIKMKTAHAIGEYMGFSIQSNGNEVDIIGAEYQKDDGSFKVTSQGWSCAARSPVWNAAATGWSPLM